VDVIGVVVRVPPVLEVVFDADVEFDDNDPAVAAIRCQSVTIHLKTSSAPLIKSLELHVPAQVSSRYFNAVARSAA
jgi:hypothetical protein